jgi:nucleoside 2-deoxyribosyltransferase
MKIYLAGPDVFLPDAVEIGRRKAAICARHGLTGLYPLDNGVDLTAAGASLAIFKGNEAMMDSADAIIANLTPFRGPSADAGTVYELGYMAGRGKLCFAYSNDPALYTERVARSFAVTKAAAGHLIDNDGLTVEDFGLPDNLMMIHTLDLHGARAFSSEVEAGSRQENASKQESRAPFRFNRNGKGSRLVMPRQRPVDIWHDLASFEACVALAADRVAAFRADSKSD